MVKRAKLKWFAVKTAYRTSIQGKPKRKLPNYDAAGTLVEERVVLVRARDHEHALAIAEKEADRYVRKPYTNSYGQRVTWRRLKRSVRSYALFEDQPPGHLGEVWSSTQIIPRSVTDARVLGNLFGPAEIDRLQRMKFIDAKIFKRKELDSWFETWSSGRGVD
jgi:hypothetical protein